MARHVAYRVGGKGKRKKSIQCIRVTFPELVCRFNYIIICLLVGGGGGGGFGVLREEESEKVFKFAMI